MKSLRYWILAGLVTAVVVDQQSAAQTSQWVHYGHSGRLIYQMDHRGDRLLDYSTAGYKLGEPVPAVEDVVDLSRYVNLSPIAGDNRAHIENAINQVAAMPLNANGYRGVVQLAPGQYDISDTLEIGASGVILRGAGDGSASSSNTILRSTSTNQINMIEVGNFVQYANNLFPDGPAINILDEVVPAGVTSFRVADATSFSPGDWVNVKRTPTQAWFDLVAGHFPDPEAAGWTPDDDRYTFQQERVITRIEGDRVFINAPLSHSIDPRSNGTIEHYTNRRVSNVGIQGIRGTSVFNANETGVYNGRVQFDDEDHASTFIQFLHAKDSWAQNVTGEHLKDSAVAVGIASRSVTVDNAKYVEPVSVVTGGRRYAFNTTGQLVLMQNLEADSARRAFINNSTFNGFNRGPNVFFNGVSTNGFVRSGPHARYSTGALYDNLSDDFGFEARFSSSTSVHGWRGGHTVIWNSDSPVFQVTSPPGANNYLIGATGSSSSPNPDNAIVDSFGTRIAFDDPENPLDSLYIAQVLEKQRFAHEQSRDYWIGDFDELQPGNAVDQQPVDPDWLLAIDSLSSSFHSSQPVTTFDDDSFGRRVPFTINYDLADDEVVQSAVLTLGMKKNGGSSSDDDLLWLDSTDNPLSFSPAGWGPLFENNLQVLTLELLGDLTYLQDGQLNGVLSNNRAIDWVHLQVNVATVDPFAGDFNADMSVNGADYLVWQQGLGNVHQPAELQRWRDTYGATNALPTGDLITPVSAIASGETSLRAVENVINGNGLVFSGGDPNDPTAYTHNGAADKFGQGDVNWMDAGTIDDMWVIVDLGDVYDLATLSFFNFGVSEENRNERGVMEAEIYYRTDGVGGNVDGNGLAFDPSGWILLGSETFAVGPTDGNLQGPDIVDLSGVVARYIALDINSNYGQSSSLAGIGELQFFGTLASASLEATVTVPEPATWCVLSNTLLLAIGRFRQLRGPHRQINRLIERNLRPMSTQLRRKQ